MKTQKCRKMTVSKIEDWLDHAERITFKKFQKNILTGCKDMGKKHKKVGVFPHK